MQQQLYKPEIMSVGSMAAAAEADHSAGRSYMRMGSTAAVAEAAHSPAEADMRMTGAPVVSEGCFAKGDDARLPDGGGLASNADWSSPRQEDLLADLRGAFQKLALDADLLRQFQRNVSTCEAAAASGISPPDEVKRPWLSEDIAARARSILFSFLYKQGLKASDKIDEGQPFVLEAWEAVAKAAKDQDLSLFPLLKEGVPSGFFGNVEATGLFPPSKHVSCEVMPDHTYCCERSWKSAESDLPKTKGLIQKHLDEGWLLRYPGTVEDAKREFAHVAVGSFSVASAEGKDDRLCGDCTVSLANPIVKRKLPETTENPTHEHIRAALRRNAEAGHPKLGCFTLDIKSAHTRVRLHRNDQGLLFFALANELYRYMVNCFGACWAQFWWGRCGASILRLCHVLIHEYHFSFLYVDDFLFLVPVERIWLDLCVVVLFMSAMGVPLSWHKIRAGMKVGFIGVNVLSFERLLELPGDKFVKAQGFLRLLTEGAKIPRKEFESGLGFLMWIATIAHYLKPWLASLFRDMLRVSRVKRQVDAAGMAAVASCVLGQDRIVEYDIPGLQIKAGWKLRRKHEDLLPIGFAGSRELDFIVPCPSRVTISHMSAKVARFWRASLKSMPALRNCDRLKPLPGAGAADACAQGQFAGIGGWWHSGPGLACPQTIKWFHLVLSHVDLPEFELSCNAQLDIAFWEAFAQCVLLLLRLEDSGPSSCCVSLTHGCDNAAVVGGSKKLFSSKSPLCFALQMLSSVATVHNCELKVEFLPGIQNEWADKLSRWKKLEGFRPQLNPKLEHTVDVKSVLAKYWSL